MNNLLDTTVFVDYLRGDLETNEYLSRQPIIRCSIITAAEILRGANNKKAQKETEKLLSRIQILPVIPSIGELMVNLIKQYSLSHGLEIPDALIAATSIEGKLTLVTANTKHFSFIKDLLLLEWDKVKENQL